MESSQEPGPSTAFVYSDQEASTSKRKAVSSNGNIIAKKAKPGTVRATGGIQEYGIQTYVREGSSKNSENPGEGCPKRTKHGDIFQLKLLMLVLWRGKENEQPKYEEFRLATEMPEAGGFDDIAFQYREGNIDEWKFRLIQAKHREKKAAEDPLEKIKLGHLLSTNDNEPFSLQKYFRSFLKIKQRSGSEARSIYSVFPGSRIEDVIIITNTDFDVDTKKQIIFESAGSIKDDPLFKTSKKDSWMCKLDLSDERNRRIIDKFKINFENTSDFRRLVETLADHFCNNKKVDKNVAIFKEYFYPLVRKILKVNDSKSKDKKSKFFIDMNILRDKAGLNEEELEIRGALMKEIAFQKGTVEIPTIDDSLIHGSMLPTDKKEVEELAAKLAKCIVNGQELTVKDFEQYHVALGNEVINLEEGKFDKTFIREPEKSKDKKPSILGKFKSYLKSHLQPWKGIRNDHLKNRKIFVAEGFGRRRLSNTGGISLSVLAKKIAEFIKYNTEITLEDFLDHPGLGKEVFDKEMGKFCDIFVKGQNANNDKLSSVGKALRRRLIDELYDMNIEIKICNQNMTMKEFEANFSQDLFHHREIAVSEGFVTSIVQENPKIEDVNLFTAQVCNLFKSQGKKQKVIKLNNDLKLHLKMRNEEFKKFTINFKKLGGHVLVKKFNNLRFSTAFLKSETLRGNLGQFRANFKELLGSDVFASLVKYEFKLDEEFKTRFRTCEDGEIYKKLPVEHNDEDVNEFFEKLKFLVNYPNRKRISKLLGEEIGNKFKILDGKAFGSLYYERLHSWIADRVGTFYSAANAGTLFDKIKDNLTLWAVDGRNQQYFADISHYKFKRHIDFCNFLSGNEKVLHLVFADLVLGRTRIVQTFQQLREEDSPSLQKYTREFGHIFLTSKLLGNHAFRSEVFKQIAKKHLFNLIVIEVDKTSDSRKLSKQLQTTIKKGKKIVFITTNDSDVPARKLGSSGPKYDESSVDDIEDIYKKDLLQVKSVIFQDQQKRISLADLMHVDVDDYLQINGHDLCNLICAETFIRLVKGEDINIGHAVPLYHGYDKDYYIDRKFNHAAILNEDKIQRDIEKDKKILKSDLLVISGACRKLVKDNINIFDASDFESKGIQYDPCKATSIHFLKTDSKKLIFDKTQGSVSNLLSFRDVENTDVFENPKNAIKEDDLVDFNSNKTVIIADTAGTGKSTVLAHFSYLIRLKEKNLNMWVIRINLSDVSEVLNAEIKDRKDEKPSFSKDDMNAAVEFLLNKVLSFREELKLTSKTEEFLFKNSFEVGGKITLIFDGFDEISPDYEKVVIELIQALNKSEVVKLFVTTRPNMRTLVERKLEVFSLILNPFSKGDQIEFLTKFWTKKLKLTDLNQEQREQLNTYAGDLIDKFFSSINDKTFTAIPLHIQMLAEVFATNHGDHQTEQGCKEFLDSKQAKPVLPDLLDLCDLYRRFVNIKFKFIHLKEKKGRNFFIVGEEQKADEECKLLEEKHEILALYRLFSENDLKSLLSPERFQNLSRWAVEINTENAGIINDLIRDKPQFIHLTFADYFTANFVGIRHSQENENEVRKLVLTEILMESKYNIIRMFLLLYKKKEQLNKVVWNEGMSKLLDIAYSYDYKFDNDNNLFEKMLFKRVEDEEVREHRREEKEEGGEGGGGEEEEEADDLRFLYDILKQHGYESIFDRLGSPFFVSAFGDLDYSSLGLLSEYIDNEKLVDLMCKCSLLRHLADECTEDDQAYFEEFFKKRGLTTNQLEIMFDDETVWEDLAPGNYRFVNMMISLLDDRSAGRILLDYYYIINGRLDRHMIPDAEYKKIQDLLEDPTKLVLQEVLNSLKS